MDNVYHNPVTQAMIMIDSDNDSGGGALGAPSAEPQARCEGRKGGVTGCRRQGVIAGVWG